MLFKRLKDFFFNIFFLHTFVFVEPTQLILNHRYLYIITRTFLNKAEEEGVVLTAVEDIPKSFVVCDHPYHRQIVYISQLNSSTLARRAAEQREALQGEGE